jgi:transcriptional regulator with XRE-family HTH domain
MKPAETKQEFIRLRAEGLSYRAIQERLGVSKSTCQTWESKYKDQIAELKADQMKELYDAYGMTKEARIKKLGDTLSRLQSALDGVDLSQLPPDKLLDFYLKYADALKSEYTPPRKPIAFNKNDRDTAELIDAIADLLNRIRAGEITSDQANRESTAIANLLKAYNTEELQAKIETLEAIIETRS